MLIGELAKQSGLSKEGIRYYESLGLIYSDDRTAGSRIYREYRGDTVERLDLIRIGKMIGFTLKELKPLIDIYFSGELTAEQAQQALTEKIAEVEQRIEQLQGAREMLIYKRDLVADEQSFQQARLRWSQK